MTSLSGEKNIKSKHNTITTIIAIMTSKQSFPSAKPPNPYQGTWAHCASSQMDCTSRMARTRRFLNQPEGRGRGSASRSQRGCWLEKDCWLTRVPSDPGRARPGLSHSPRTRMSTPTRPDQRDYLSLRRSTTLPTIPYPRLEGSVSKNMQYHLLGIKYSHLHPFSLAEARSQPPPKNGVSENGLLSPR